MAGFNILRAASADGPWTRVNTGLIGATPGSAAGRAYRWTDATAASGTYWYMLEAVGLAGKPVVVEQNQVALLPREIQTAVVNDGDVIEIVQITAGG